jgi:hypothetical protein
MRGRGGWKKRKEKGGGQVINKRVRMSDPHKIGVQLFLLMMSHGNLVCTQLPFLYHSVVFKLLNKNNIRTRCHCPLFARKFVFLPNTAMSCAYDGPREAGLFPSRQRTNFFSFFFPMWITVYCVGCDILIATAMEITYFWEVTPYSLIQVYRRFGGTYLRPT